MSNSKSLTFEQLSQTSSDNAQERKEKKQKIRHHTDEHGNTWYPDSETMDLVEELQRVLRRSATRLIKKDPSELRVHVQSATQRKKLALARFRAAVHLIMLTRVYPNYDQQPSVSEKSMEERSRIPYFNVSYYCRSIKKTQLPHLMKVIMSKPPWLRSEEDIELVFKHVFCLGYFDKYPPITLRHMAPYLNYQFVPANRIVIRQGQMPQNFYYVLTGTLTVCREERDARTGVMISRLAGKVRSGDTFGEISLMQNIPRTATVTTKFDSELLWLHKTEFDLLLKEKAHYEWWGRSRAIEQLDAFHVGWTPEARLECSNSSTLVNYRTNKIITGNVSDYPEFLYFITSGECHMVEVLRMLCHNVALGRPFAFKMLSEDEPVCIPKHEGTIVRRFVQIMKLTKGQYFGCGEDLRQRYIIARSNVQCIQIPHTFLRRKGYVSWVVFLMDKLQASIPPHEYVFHKFVEQASWRAYKKTQIAEVIRRQTRRKKDCTGIREVPQSIRSAEISANWNSVLST